MVADGRARVGGAGRLPQPHCCLPLPSPPLWWPSHLLGAAWTGRKKRGAQALLSVPRRVAAVLHALPKSQPRGG
eukprot:11069796-Alexandrium_andersonii.AAC.1